MIWKPWTKGGSGALSEIPTDNEHVSVVWGQGQSGGLPPSVRIYLILCLTQLPLVWVSTYHSRQILGLC